MERDHDKKQCTPTDSISFVDSFQRLGSGCSWDVSLGDMDWSGDIDAFVAHGELGQDSDGGIPNEVRLNQPRYPQSRGLDI